MALTASEETILLIANDAYSAGEDIGSALNNMMEELQHNADGLRGAAGNTFQRIQGEAYQQVDKMNRALDELAEKMINASKGLSMSDLDHQDSLNKVWEEGADANAEILSKGKNG